MSASRQIPDGSIHLSAKRPITVDVDNAITIGLNESIVLSQLRYWIEDTTSGEVVDGERWVYNTYEGWRKSNFPFWSVATIRRVFSSLEDMELIKSRDDLNPKGSDRTKWYTVNFSHSAYGQGVSRPSAQNEQAMCSKRAGHVLKMSSSSIAETTTENTIGESTSQSSAESAPKENPSDDGANRKVSGGEKPKRRKTPVKDFPPDWSVTPELLAWGEGRGVSDVDMEYQAEKFADHHIAKGSQFADWDRAFQNWLRNAIEFGQVKPRKIVPKADLEEMSKPIDNHDSPREKMIREAKEGNGYAG